MILRRVIAHVRKQEWTATGIDFVIVVFGVFFGIQVSNWNARSAGDLALITDPTLSVASAQVWAHCHSAPAFDEQYLKDCDSPMSEAQAQAVLDAYLADQQLLRELRYWITTLEVSITLIELNAKAARELITQLPGEADA